jgi:hypothetical protein
MAAGDRLPEERAQHGRGVLGMSRSTHQPATIQVAWRALRREIHWTSLPHGNYLEVTGASTGNYFSPAVSFVVARCDDVPRFTAECRGKIVIRAQLVRSLLLDVLSAEA